MKISEVGEFKLIHRMVQSLRQKLPAGVIGSGDDAAVIPQTPERSLLITTDLLIEGVHFLKSAISPEDLGYKCLAVNLSDIAAMGGVPTYAFLSLALPAEIELNWMDRFYEGFKGLAHLYGVLLLGGDTTRSQDSLMINITLLGDIKKGQERLRSFAKVGDLICVTDSLGDSAAGLKEILNPSLEPSSELKVLIERHYRPQPAVLEGPWLAKHEGVHAMMDVSDGIHSDLYRIMELSDCGAQINLDQIPLSDSLRWWTQQREEDPLELAVAGGEDYCLLLSVDRSAYPQIAKAFKDQFHKPLYEIGEITANKGELQYKLRGQPHKVSYKGFHHF